MMLSRVKNLQGLAKNKFNFKNKEVLAAAVVISALGYFVDIYDLLLFSIVRTKSLSELGLTAQEITEKGLLLINIQMTGMLIGGIFFGILGDKKGRLSILLSSIVLYSVANLLNAFVQTTEQYMVLRFIAGLGLAGELGAGVSLVVESLSKENRGLGTMIIASIGVSGAILAWIISELFSWRYAYAIGGMMGILLLLMRIQVLESGMFQRMQKGVKRGQFLDLFIKKNLFKKYLSSILIASQTWFVVGILITLSPEFAKELGVTGSIQAGKSVMFCYMGLAVGDFISGWLSYKWKSRRKVLLLFLLSSAVAIFTYLFAQNITVNLFYLLCCSLGFASGYWAIFVTIAAERFGTNLRATVATTAPNFARGSLLLVSLGFTTLKSELGILKAAMVVAFICIFFSLLGLWMCEETFGKDLDYIEY